MPDGGFWTIKLDGIFALVSSIATTAAAIAAWKAAGISAKQGESAESQAESASQQSRLQFYMQHWATFNEWLDGIERDNKVGFYKRSILYDSIFPNNRDISKAFSSVGSGELRSWQEMLGEILDRTCSPVGFKAGEVQQWFFDYARLSGYMNYNYLDPEEDQLILGNSLPSGISTGNYDKVYVVMSRVLESLSKFAYCEGAPKEKGISKEVRVAVLEFMGDAGKVLNPKHSYGKWNGLS